MNSSLKEVGPSSAPPQTHPWNSPMMNATRGEPIEILLVEDNPDDADLTLGALREGRVRNRVSVVDDGVEALAFLYRQGRHLQAPRPDLILLDLNLPRKNGREVLAEIKQDPDLRRIPVVIMTSSDDEKDILAAYDLHVNCYVTKPVDLDQFIKVVQSIEHFWLSVVKLPAA
jgi:chemotaxis family two-component system response regulator Rcp1